MLASRFAGVRLTVRGVICAVAAAVGAIVAYAAGWPALLAVCLFLGAAALAAIGFVVVSPPMVQVERRVDPPVVEQGASARVRVTVRGANGGLEWRERTAAGAQVSGAVSGVFAGGDPVALVEYRIAARRRGALPIGPFAVVRTDPLGLAAAERRTGGTDPLIVLPRLSEVDVPSVVTRTDPDSAASTAFGPVGDQRDIVSREYRAGDPMRSVDWRATAHRGELMVRTGAAAAASSTAIALDSRADAWRDRDEFEDAVEYAASTAFLLGERRATVRFASDRSTPVSPDAAATLVALATVERDRAAPRPAELAARLFGADVRVLHVVTGPFATEDLKRLPPLPHGTSGIVTVIGRGEAPQVPPGWRVEVRDGGPATVASVRVRSTGHA